LRRLPETVKPLFTPSELASLVATFRGWIHRRQRLAVLYRNDRHHGARMFAFISRCAAGRFRRSEILRGFVLALRRPKMGGRGRSDICPVRFASREAEAKKRPTGNQSKARLNCIHGAKMASATLAAAPVGVSPGHRTSGHH
jgi:hypothetical protein